MADDALELEELAFRAWPAAEVEVQGGWRLRASGGPTRRANSVWPGPGPGDAELDARGLAGRIARAERFYAERGLAPRFQLFPGASPPGLDAALARRGWQAEAPVSVQVAGAAVLAAAEPPAGLEVRLSGSPTPAWWSIAGERSRFAGVQPGLRALLARLEGRAGYALAYAAGTPAAVGLGVADGGWVGVFSMLTLPAFRRRGAARAVLAELARFALARGAARLYLQVERANGPALTLYADAAFREHHGYHYRAHPAGAAAGSRWPRLALRRHLRPDESAP